MFLSDLIGLAKKVIPTSETCALDYHFKKIVTLVQSSFIKKLL